MVQRVASHSPRIGRVAGSTLIALALLLGLVSCTSFMNAVAGVDSFELEFSGNDSNIKYASFDYELRNESRSVASDQKLAKDQYQNLQYENLVADRPIAVPGHLNFLRSQRYRIVLKFATSEMKTPVQVRIFKNAEFFREVKIGKSLLGSVLIEL